MKKVIPAILLLFFSAQIIESQTIEQRVQVLESNSSNFICKIQVALDKDSSVVGNVVSRFNFDAETLSFPTEADVLTDYSFHQFPGINYNSTVTMSSRGTVSLNILSISNSSKKLKDKFIDLATINFKVINFIENNSIERGLQQFFAPYSTTMWNIGAISISSLDNSYIPHPLYPINEELITIQAKMFKWSQIDLAESYELEVSLDPSFNTLLISKKNIISNEFKVKDLVSGKKYYWRVRAQTNLGFSHFSKKTSFIIPIEEPTDLLSSSYNDNAINLTWNNNSLAGLNIVIERKISEPEENTEFEVIDTVDGRRTTYLDSFIESDKKYTYRVQAINNESSSAYSDSVSISMKVQSDETNSELPKEFQLQQNYPNPFNPQTTINYALKENSDVKIIVYSLLGERIATLVNKSQNAGTHDVIWNASHLPSGIYIYVMTAESKISDQTFQNVKKMILLK